MTHTLGILIFDKVELLDFCGPYEIFSGNELSHRVTWNTDSCHFVYDDGQDYDVEGLMFCEVLAPDINRPFLPFKTDKGNSILASCFSCANKLLFKTCNHKPEERKFTGVYTIKELIYARRMQYEITRVFEVIAFRKRSFHLR